MTLFAGLRKLVSKPPEPEASEEDEAAELELRRRLKADACSVSVHTISDSIEVTGPTPSECAALLELALQVHDRLRPP